MQTRETWTVTRLQGLRFSLRRLASRQRLRDTGRRKARALYQPQQSVRANSTLLFSRQRLCYALIHAVPFRRKGWLGRLRVAAEDGRARVGQP